MTLEDPRTEVAREAARLICEQGIRDYAVAKNKALAALGNPRGPAPSNLEIADQVREHLQIFEPEAHKLRLKILRETALKAMRLCAEFQPRAVGAVVDGLATVGAIVQIHLFCEFDEQIDIFLQNQNIPYDEGEKRLRRPDGQETRRPVCVLQAGEIEVELVVFGLDDLRWAPLSAVDGRPMLRWKTLELEQAFKC